MADQEEVEIDIKERLEGFNSFMDRFTPYRRWILIVGFIILVMLVVYLGYARGALDVCNDLGGRLEINKVFDIECRPSPYCQDDEEGFDITVVPQNGH